jgi:hypothetical protein
MIIITCVFMHSTGSASDLRAMNEDELQGEEEDSTNHTLGLLNDETISESIITCGSSAYHAECESLATRDDDDDDRHHYKVLAVKRDATAICQQTVVKDKTDSNDRHDLLFVGHQYGEKPLLADDELDSDDDGTKSPPVQNSYWRHPADEEANKGMLWERDCPGKDVVIDVFALAPFQKPAGSSCRRGSSRGSNRKVSAHYQSRSQPTSQTVSPMDILTGGRKSSLLISASPLPVPVTPPKDAAPLVDLGDSFGPNSVPLAEPMFVTAATRHEHEEGPRNLPQRRYSFLL